MPLHALRKDRWSNYQLFRIAHQDARCAILRLGNIIILGGESRISALMGLDAAKNQVRRVLECQAHDAHVVNDGRRLRVELLRDGAESPNAKRCGSRGDRKARAAAYDC